MAKKYYAVVKGHKTGVFSEDWNTVKTYTEGYKGAIYKGFKDLDKAEKYFKEESDKLKDNEHSLKNLVKPTDKYETSKSLPNKISEDMKNNLLDIRNSSDYGTDYFQIEQELNNKYNACFYEDLENHDFDKLTIFTDGSVKVGANNTSLGTSWGMVVLHKGKIIHVDSKMYDDEHNAQRNVSGELRGILTAIKYADDNGFDSFDLCFDYIGAVLYIQSFDGKKKWKPKQLIGKKYEHTFHKMIKDIDIQFVKVLAHSNTFYNEMADKLAKDSFVEGKPYLNKLKKEYGLN